MARVAVDSGRQDDLRARAHGVPGQYCVRRLPLAAIACWYNAITSADSTNSGATFTQPAAPPSSWRRSRTSSRGRAQRVLHAEQHRALAATATSTRCSAREPQGRAAVRHVHHAHARPERPHLVARRGTARASRSSSSIPTSGPRTRPRTCARRWTSQHRDDHREPHLQHVLPEVDAGRQLHRRSRRTASRRASTTRCRTTCSTGPTRSC